MPSKKKIDDVMKRPLEKICDDAGENGKKTEWHFDSVEKVYVRLLDGVPIRAIKGENIPNPNDMEKKMQDTLGAIIKHVSVEKIEQVAGEAILKGNDPGKAIFDHFQPRTKCSPAVHSMWQHWQTIKGQ